MSAPGAPSDRPGLARVLGLREGIAIHINLIIGSGIFIVPAIIAGHLQAMGPILLVWIVAGLLTFFGALTLAELASVLPEAGGPYVYLRHGFGRVWAFLFSWNDCFINKAGSIAAVTVAFVTYLGFFVPALSPGTVLASRTVSLLGHQVELTVSATQLAAMAVVAVITAINVIGVALSGWIVNIFTAAKLTALVGLTAAALLSPRGSTANLTPWWPEHWGAEMLPAFGLAMIAALWAYDGWISVTLTAGEITNPRRNVPLALLLGTAVIIVLYLLANLAYAWVIPLHEMPASPRIAADVASRVLGPTGAALVVIGIMCSTFGTSNGMMLTGPRSLYAAGLDGTFDRRFGKVHRRLGTPYVAVLTLGAWAAILTLSGTFEQITSYVVFGSWWFYALTVASVIALRRKLPDAPRPFRAWGYPYLTLCFLAIAGWFLANTIVSDPRNATIGIALIAASLPFYWLWSRQRRSVGGNRV